jgi:hypothetical protein
MYHKYMVFPVAACFGMFLSMPGWAAAKDNLVVTGLTDSNGFTPDVHGNPAEFFYASTIPAGIAVADTIPIQFDLSGTAGNTYTITLDAHGQPALAGAITFDAPSFGITVPTSALLHYAYINTTALAAGDYHANIQINASPASGVDITHSTLHLLIHVVDRANEPPNCYVTDSTGLLLFDCAGDQVFSGGEFLVVSNKTKITATNPGQFYFNFVWTNGTGGDVTFTSLGLTGTNVVPAGTNSVHVLIYDATGFTASFDDVNKKGIPCGTVGAACKSPITVPAGETLWLTWHVAYQWLGHALWGDIPAAGAAGCGLTSTHGTITMSAVLLNADGSVSLSCDTSANGQNIR